MVTFPYYKNLSSKSESDASYSVLTVSRLEFFPFFSNIGNTEKNILVFELE